METNLVSNKSDDVVELVTSFLFIFNIARLGVIETSFSLIFSFTSYAFW